MFELLKIAQHGDFHNRVFPIVLNDADIYKARDRIKYVRYWENEIQELDEEMRTVSQANLQGIREDLDLYTEIRANLSKLTQILADMNSLTVRIHTETGFADLIGSLERALANPHSQ
jgi:internalin A